MIEKKKEKNYKNGRLDTLPNNLPKHYCISINKVSFIEI
jgi:hypothetical protein